MRLINAEPLEKILHLRCAQCSNDYGSIAGAISGCLKLVQAQHTITPPPNDPLTLEELLGMVGEPVYAVDLTGDNPGLTGYIVFDYHREGGFHPISGGWFYDCGYGKTWLAYRRRLEEDAPC